MIQIRRLLVAGLVIFLFTFSLFLVRSQSASTPDFDAVESVQGNGAVITTNPDAPINLAEVQASKTKSTIGLSWEAASFTGGDVIIDYRISIAEQGGSFSVLASDLTVAEYTAIGLTLPLRTCGIMALAVSVSTCRLPPIKSLSAGAVPL